MKTIKNIISRINDKLVKARNYDVEETFHSFNFVEGIYLIEAYITEETCEVNIINPRDYNKEYPNVCEMIEDSITPWNDVEISQHDYWGYNGFSSESDFIKYKYG